MSSGAKQKVKRLELDLKELKDIVERAGSGALSSDEQGKLGAAVDTLAVLTSELEAKGASVRRLRKLIFGASTEKTSNLKGRGSDNDESGGDEGEAETDKAAEERRKRRRRRRKAKDKPKGHGRNGAADYPGAEKIKVPHPTLEHGAHCAGCQKGRVYHLAKPKVLVRITGMAPFCGKVYELASLRCNLCGDVFSAKAPDGVGDKKYDESVAAMVAVLKYGCGLPFARLERLQRDFGIPMPASTQWELVEAATKLLSEVYAELIRQAAQGEVLYNDDTAMTILELSRPPPEPSSSGDAKDERKGTFTSSIVSTRDGKEIALFFSGWKHAGENLADVLEQREARFGPAIQMCDMLSRNTPGAIKTILGGCNAHARRKFVEVYDSFPDECLHVLDELALVYENDDHSREEDMSKEARLAYHQARSAPVMKRLKDWMNGQLDERKVEPNSGLGEAMGFMLKHWERLTLFLRVPGAPLDNNVCERAVKKAILHRKNSYFYKSENGARVGDMLMAFIYTAERHKVGPFDYLVTVLRNHKAVAQHPGEWMPWNYTEALARLSPTTAAPA